MGEKCEKQIEILQKMYQLNVALMSLTEDELRIFLGNNHRLIQNLKDSLSY